MNRNGGTNVGRVSSIDRHAGAVRRRRQSAAGASRASPRRHRRRGTESGRRDEPWSPNSS